MPRARTFLQGGFVLAFVSACVTQAQTPDVTTAHQLADFSEAGYGARGEPIPKVRVVRRVEAGDGRSIQSAIDALSAMPLGADGWRGTILLAPRTYRLSEPILVRASGLVIRGQSTAEGRTTLAAAAPLETMIVVAGEGRLVREGPAHPIANPVRIGETSVTLTEPGDLRAGDDIVVERPFTRRWISAIGMDRIPPRSDGKPVRQWTEGASLRFERRVLAVSGESIRLDAPIMEAFDIADRPTLWRASFPGRIAHIGIEELSAEGFPEPLERAGAKIADTFIAIDGARDAWITNVAARDFATFVDIGRGARDITVDGFEARNSGEPRSPSPPGIFAIWGQRALIQNCSYEGSNAHIWTTQSLAAGPNVFRDCKAKGEKIDGGPHQRWSSGTLYERLTITGRLVVRNRRNMGTGQGWAGTSTVVWNSAASEGLMLEQPPGNRNWAFGFKGPLLANEDNPGTLVAHDRDVEPASLYEAQLRAPPPP